MLHAEKLFNKFYEQSLSLEIVPSKNKRVFHDDQAHIQDPKD